MVPLNGLFFMGNWGYFTYGGPITPLITCLFGPTLWKSQFWNLHDDRGPGPNSSWKSPLEPDLISGVKQGRMHKCVTV